MNLENRNHQLYCGYFANVFSCKNDHYNQLAISNMTVNIYITSRFDLFSAKSCQKWLSIWPKPKSSSSSGTITSIQSHYKWLKSVWWTPQSLSSKNLAAARSPGGRKQDFRKDDSWQMHLPCASCLFCEFGPDWRLRINNHLSLLTSQDTEGIFFSNQLDKRNRVLCFHNSIIILVFCLGTLCKGFGDDWIMGNIWVPVWMADLPKAPEMWCRSSVLCFALIH